MCESGDLPHFMKWKIVWLVDFILDISESIRLLSRAHEHCTGDKDKQGHYVRMSHTADLNLSNPNVPLRLAFSWEHRVDCYTKADHIIICSKLAFNTPDTR